MVRKESVHSSVLMKTLQPVPVALTLKFAQTFSASSSPFQFQSRNISFNKELNGEAKMRG